MRKTTKSRSPEQIKKDLSTIRESAAKATTLNELAEITGISVKQIYNSLAGHPTIHIYPKEKHLLYQYCLFYKIFISVYIFFL